MCYISLHREIFFFFPMQTITHDSFALFTIHKGQDIKFFWFWTNIYTKKKVAWFFVSSRRPKTAVDDMFAVVQTPKEKKLSDLLRQLYTIKKDADQKKKVILFRYIYMKHTHTFQQIAKRFKRKKQLTTDYL